MATITRLVSFVNVGTEGISPSGALVTDANGDLIGTTSSGGGTDQDGTVFEITHSGTGFASTPTTLATFNGTNGANPEGALLTDANGNLFGTAPNGASGYGDVFEIANTATGYASAATDLASFNNTDGAYPVGNLIVDANGDLIGTAPSGGPSIVGVVYKIANTATGFAHTPTAITDFTVGDFEPITPNNALVADADGDLFGTTQGGGTSYEGAIIEVTKTIGGYASTPTTLASFDGADGEAPSAGLYIDAQGDLFGTTKFGGADSDGTVFELPKTASGYASTPVILVSFDGSDGSSPLGSLIADANGDLFGTTSKGGSNSDGTVFEIVNTATGYASTPVFISFAGTNGSAPQSSLIADASGDLFGTTNGGGTAGGGTVFELTGFGFQVACYLRGTMIATPAGERAIEALTVGDLVLTLSGEPLPIAWIGCRRIICSQHLRQDRIWPIRVCAGAFADSIPHRDLWLSPDHAVFVENVLIPIKYLVNGSTIKQLPRREVVYYHIELPRHDVLLANGLPAESFLNNGNRPCLARGGEAYLLSPDSAMQRREAEGYAPLVVVGPEVRAVQRHVATRAAKVARYHVAESGQLGECERLDREACVSERCDGVVHQEVIVKAPNGAASRTIW